MTIKWLLDTNTCIAVMNNRPAKVRKTLLTKTVDSIGISAIVLYELKYGVYKSKFTERNKQSLQAFCQYIQVSPWTEECADAAGRFRAELEAQGKPIGPHDLLIAAHAKTLNATLVTANVREFKRIKGLKIENWIR